VHNPCKNEGKVEIRNVPLKQEVNKGKDTHNSASNSVTRLLRPLRSIVSEIQGRQRSEERAKTPMIIPMFDLEPPLLAIKRGTKKNISKLDKLIL